MTNFHKMRGILEGGWDMYDMHHILPRKYGGTNDFWNLVPALRSIHQGPAPYRLSARWKSFHP
jgi:hypothetical protein